jgi:hypothetical protein
MPHYLGVVHPDLPHHMWRLFEEELAYIHDLARRAAEAQLRGRAEGKQYDIDGRTLEVRFREGFAAEYAAAAHYGARFQGEDNMGRRDPGYDLEVEGSRGTMFKMGVKATRFSPPWLKVKVRECRGSRDVCDGYLLAFVSLTSGLIKLCGWMDTEEVKKLPVMKVSTSERAYWNHVLKDIRRLKPCRDPVEEVEDERDDEQASEEGGYAHPGGEDLHQEVDEETELSGAVDLMEKHPPEHVYPEWWDDHIEEYTGPIE